ncbi:unnamed protein product [Lymnaea stagnalis]|uniref:Uncharacterized protein n=1 Tax=Lymnaea stagnalis TaxID=6523 RepID=A0AAV2HN07_LYMST
MNLRQQVYHTNMLFVILAIAQCIAQQIGATVYQEYLKPPIVRDLFNTVHPIPRLGKLRHIHYFLFSQQLSEYPFHRISAAARVVHSPEELSPQSHQFHLDLNRSVKPAYVVHGTHKAMASSPRLNFRNGVQFVAADRGFLVDKLTRDLLNPFPVGIGNNLESIMSRISSHKRSSYGQAPDPSFLNGAQTKTFSGASEFPPRTSDLRVAQQLSEDDLGKRSSPETACKPRRLSLEWLINVLRRGKVCIKRANILRWGAGGR